MQSTGNDDMQKHDRVKVQFGTKKSYNWPKESSAKRRERRVRADMRLFNRLVGTAQVTCAHHTQDTALAKVIFAFMHRTQSQAESAATSFQQRPSPSERFAGSLRAEAPAFVPAPAGCLVAVAGPPPGVAAVPAAQAPVLGDFCVPCPFGAAGGVQAAAADVGASLVASMVQLPSTGVGGASAATLAMVPFRRAASEVAAGQKDCHYT